MPMKSKFKKAVYKLCIATVGNLLVFLKPEKAKQLAEEGLTIVNKSNTMSISERLMRGAILKKLEKNQDYNNLEELHKKYWSNKGSIFFQETESSFEKEFLPNCAFIFDELEKNLFNTPIQYTTLVEIGTGNGRVLEYLCSKFPKVTHFIGIDLSPAQIDINSKKYKNNPKMEFVATDGFDWVKEHGASNTIFVTSRGVLEYFTEKRLQAFFNYANTLGKTIFIAIEPKGIEHDFAKNNGSQPYGYERSFSHNYELLFKNAGFDVWHLSYKPLDDLALMGFIGAAN